MITAEQRRTKNKELQEAIYPRLIKRIEDTMDYWNNLGQLYCEFDITVVSDYSEVVMNGLRAYGYKVELREFMDDFGIDSKINMKRTILNISWAE